MIPRMSGAPHRRGARSRRSPPPADRASEPLRGRGPGRAAVVSALVALAALGTAGCGDSGPKVSSKTIAPPPGAPAPDLASTKQRADLETRNLLRGAISAAETCFGSADSYVPCRTREQLTPFASEQRFGPFLEHVVAGDPKPGEIAVQVATRRQLRILATSRSGNRFAYSRSLPRDPSRADAAKTTIFSCLVRAFPESESCEKGRWG